MYTISPWSAEDNIGLLRSAIRSNVPVMFLENEMMYNIEFDLSPEVMDPNFMIPIGKAKVEK